MQINRNEQSDLNAFIADLKNLGFEVEVKIGHVGFMMPDKDGKPTFVVSLPIDRYDFYPHSNTIVNGYGSTFAVEKTDKEFKRILLVSKLGNIEIAEAPVYYND